MEWTSYQAALLAEPRCPLCQGLGFCPGLPPLLCDCVYRAVFHACFVKFRQCAKADPYRRLVTFERNLRGVDRRLTWARRNEDYCADFRAAGQRALPNHLYRVFRFYHLLGAAGELVMRRLAISRRSLTVWITEVEVNLGRELAHMRPYSLFPPHEYMRSGMGTSAAENASSVA